MDIMKYILLVICVVIHGSFAVLHMDSKVCSGTNSRMLHVQKDDRQMYEMLRTRYSNCTYVRGNLEIYRLMMEDGRPYDLSFLSSIQEVTGYVAIIDVYVDVPLYNLRLIRGHELWEENSSLIVRSTANKARTIGTRLIQLNNLQEISNGNIELRDNPFWCYQHKVDFKDILNKPTQTVNFGTVDSAVSNKCNKKKCHVSCDGLCWGPGPDDCQKKTKGICAAQCGLKRCMGPGIDQCCHEQCAAGCHAPEDDTKCFACAKYFDQKSGRCVSGCGAYMYTYSTLCIVKCPANIYAELRDTSTRYCLNDCENSGTPGQKMFANPKTMQCEPCPNKRCPKSCRWTHLYVTSKNIDELDGCQEVKGHIVINQRSFDGFNHSDSQLYVAPMHPSRLGVMRNISVISGDLHIYAKHSEFTELDFLPNLVKILHQSSTEEFALKIVHSSLEIIQLKSLEKIEAGGVHIEANQNLCIANQIRWMDFRSCNSCRVVVGHNAPFNQCAAAGLECHSQCVHHLGCWGLRKTDCVNCSRYRLETGACVSKCSADKGLYLLKPGVCGVCHPQCSGGCNGTKATDCFQCKNVMDKGICKSTCPRRKYPDQRGVCQVCHSACGPDSACVGPEDTLSPIDGCLKCPKAIATYSKAPNVSVAERMYNCVESCPDQYHEVDGKLLVLDDISQSLKQVLQSNTICEPCDEQCDGCRGFGEQKCLKCRNFWKKRHHASDSVVAYDCLGECLSTDYTDVEEIAGVEVAVCVPCHAECLSCVGPGDMNCTECKNSPHQLPNGLVRCLPSCFGESCGKANIPSVIAGSVVGVIIFILFIFFMACICRRRAKVKRKTMLITEKINSPVESEVPDGPV